MTGCTVTVIGTTELDEDPGSGLLTIRDPVPWLCRSEADKVTFRTVVLITTVGLGEPFHRATEFD